MSSRLAMFKCKCGRRFRAEVLFDGVTYTTPAAWQAVHPNWTYDLRPVAQCPACGAVRRGRAIVGRLVERITCGARCQNATGPDCDCSCAGHNHGAQFAA